MSKKLKEVALHEKDTGSSEVQIALLTDKIENLSAHMRKFKKDNIMNLLNKYGIGTRSFFYPMHNQKIFKKMKIFNSRNKFKNSEFLFSISRLTSSTKLFPVVTSFSPTLQTLTLIHI